MSVQRVAATQVLRNLSHYDTVIDARSPGEYALDRLPGAVNWWTLDNAQHARVGTIYVRQSAFEARKLGAVYAARNIAAHIERAAPTLEKNWHPLVYCRRGGQRSGALATVLGQIGFAVHVLDGGYKAFRRAMLDDLVQRLNALRFIVLCGPTGSGKTRLLHALREVGAQTLDLEDLASHRASVLGTLPDRAQPSQKRFDSLLWQAVCTADAAQPVFIEAESRKVGNLMLPDALADAMHAAPCVRVELPPAERVALLLEDYPHHMKDVDALTTRLDALTALCSRAAVQRWTAQAHAGQWHELVADLLRRHYDPGYERSTRRTFARFAQAQELVLPDRSPAALRTAARTLLRTVAAS